DRPPAPPARPRRRRPRALWSSARRAESPRGRPGTGVRSCAGAPDSGRGCLGFLVGERQAVEQETAVANDADDRRFAGAERAGAAQDNPGLRPAEQLVAREADEVGAGPERLARRRLLLT